MRRPGDTKQRPPGGGAAGRAKQFESERGAGDEPCSEEDEKESQAGGSKKTDKKSTAKPK